MNRKRSIAMVLGILVGIGFLVQGIQSRAEERSMYKIDKAKCALMLRFGKEALERSRYEDAKYYFQNAVHSDPFNAKAWNWYDLATFYAVADQMKREGKYIIRPTRPSQTPSVRSSAETRQEETDPVPESVKPPAQPESGDGFVIREDEGC